MTFIFTDICFNVNTLRDETDFDNNALLTKLLNLHQYHCGEATTCGISQHVEPSEIVLLVPCCIPCSCLSSCAEKQNCCLDSRNWTQTVPTSGRGNTVPENDKNEADNGLIIERKDMVSWNRTDDNKPELHETEVLRIENRTHSLLQRTKYSVALKLNEIDRANETCTRAHVLYRPNLYMDYQAYMMIVTCAVGFADKLIVDKCNARMDDVELLNMIPVTSKHIGLTYNNKHCLMCNEKLQAKHMIEWSAEIVSSGARREHMFLPSPDTIVNNLIETVTTFSNMHFVPGHESLTRHCEANDIISCNQLGL